MADFTTIFTHEKCKEIFPAERANQFFEALFGDAEEGAYDIALAFAGGNREQLRFDFQLTQRPGKCLACNLTTGLPQVFERHPIINVNGLARAVEKEVGLVPESLQWSLGRTVQISQELHVIPLVLSGE
jgi:hypothetical protein